MPDRGMTPFREIIQKLFRGDIPESIGALDGSGNYSSVGTWGMVVDRRLLEVWGSVGGFVESKRVSVTCACSTLYMHLPHPSPHPITDHENFSLGYRWMRARAAAADASTADATNVLLNTACPQYISLARGMTVPSHKCGTHARAGNMRSNAVA